MKQFTFTDPATGFTALVTVVDNGDGTLSVTLDVDESTGVTGDVRAIYFNNAGNQSLTGLTAVAGETDGDAATTSDTTDIRMRQEIDKVRWVDSKDTNVNGEVINENDGAFDTGIQFGTQGMATDDVQHMEFTLSSTDGLTLDSFDWTTIGLRVTSVGDVNGSRNGSLKLTGEEKPPVASTVVAENDIGEVDLTGVTAGDTVGVNGLFSADPLNWKVNDFDPEGDSFDLIGVAGAGGATAGVDATTGWSGWVAADIDIDFDGIGDFVGGEVRLNVDGRVEMRDTGDLGGGGTAIVSYTVEDTTGAQDSAQVLIEFFDFD